MNGWGDAHDGAWREASAALRPVLKVLPEHARAHNRSLVLQHLFHAGPTSRADLSRATGLNRVTISDLVGVLLVEGLVEELGSRPQGRVGKPAILVGMRIRAFQIVTVDVGTGRLLRGAVVNLAGEVVVSQSLAIRGRSGEALVTLLARFCRQLLSWATAPVIGVGVAAPGIIDSHGRVLEAPSRAWFDLPLAESLTAELGLPVYVSNDANSAVLCEYTYGGASGAGLMVIMVGEGVGAGVVLDGARVRGHREAAGEIGHVRVVDDGLACTCGSSGCLETVLSVGALTERTAGLDEDATQAALAEVGRLLGVALAPVVSVLNLAEVVLSGPPGLLGGVLRETAERTVQERTMPLIGQGFTIRMAARVDDDVLAGAAVLVLQRRLGVT